MKEEDVQKIAEDAFRDVCSPGNPRDATLEEIIDLYKSMLK
jgi:lactaldehyde reductase